MQVKTIIQGYYDGKLVKTSDFENELNKVSKEDLVQFIIDQQCQGSFSHFQEMGSYNKEYTDKWGTNND